MVHSLDELWPCDLAGTLCLHLKGSMEISSRVELHVALNSVNWSLRLQQARGLHTGLQLQGAILRQALPQQFQSRRAQWVEGQNKAVLGYYAAHLCEDEVTVCDSECLAQELAVFGQLHKVLALHLHHLLQ